MSYNRDEQASETRGVFGLILRGDIRAFDRLKEAAEVSGLKIVYQTVRGPWSRLRLYDENERDQDAESR